MASARELEAAGAGLHSNLMSFVPNPGPFRARKRRKKRLQDNWIEPELYELLVRWSKWARGSYFPASFWVKAGSLESDYLPPAGDVFQSTEEAIQKSLGSPERRVNDPEATQVEVIVMRLPEKHRTALRLHFIIRERMPFAQKRRVLGVTHDGYWELLKRSALMVRNRLIS